MSVWVQPRLSPERYLELERAAESRSEYYDGRVFAMSGGTYNHARITANLSGELYNALKNGPCSVVSNDLRIRVAPDGLYTYPDVVVVCGEPEFSDEKRDTLVNPVMIVEVLSQSTEGYDRGFKAAQYRRIASLREYALVSQLEARIEVFRRQKGGDWLLSESAGLTANCHFASVECDIALADVYGKIAFASEGSNSPHPSSSE